MTEPQFALSQSEIAYLPAAVMQVLTSGHSGEANAITAATIAERLELSGGRREGRVRLAIELLVQRGTCIAAGQNGFYLVATRDEARQYLADLHSRAVGIHERYKQFSEAAQRRFGFAVEQMELL